MKKRLLTLFGLLVLLAVYTPAIVCAVSGKGGTYCQDCSFQCHTEGAHYYMECRKDGYSDAYCSQQEDSYIENCQKLACYGCPIIY